MLNSGDGLDVSQISNTYASRQAGSDAILLGARLDDEPNPPFRLSSHFDCIRHPRSVADNEPDLLLQPCSNK